MLNRYRLYRRDNGGYYSQDNQDSSKQGSLKTKDREIAEKLLHSKNEAHRNPTLNLAIARTYLSAHDVKMSTRTWVAEMATHGIESTQTDANEQWLLRHSTHYEIDLWFKQ